MIPIYKPYLKYYKKSCLDAIESEWISNHGKYIELSSNLLKKILNVKYCILMNNGTSATHCLFKSLKYKYPHINKIYVPNNVFVSPWNCALNEYQYDQLEVMRMNNETYNIDTSEEYIMTLERNSAMLIVHNLGNIVNVPRLKRIRPDIIFVEDNCEGIFGKYENVYSGTSESSLCSSVSFYGNKTITTGEGGAFFTNDEDVYNFIKTYCNHGMSDTRYIHNQEGTNYRMTNIQASILYDQLLDINHILMLKKKVYDKYLSLYNDFTSNYKDKILLIKEEDNTQNSKWMFSLMIKNLDYQKFEKYMELNDIQIRPLFHDIHSHQHLSQINKSENIKTLDKGIMLPSFPELDYDEQKYIFDTIMVYIKFVYLL